MLESRGWDPRAHPRLQHAWPRLRPASKERLPLPSRPAARLTGLLAALLTLANVGTVSSFTGDEFRQLSIRDSRGAVGVPRAAILRGANGGPRPLVIGRTLDGDEVFQVSS